jgi:hypothetical protein
MPEPGLTSHCFIQDFTIVLCEMNIVFHVERLRLVEMGSEMLAN